MSADKKVPEIRFKGFSGEWKNFPLEEFSNVLDGDRGHNYPSGEELKEQGHTLFLSASNVTKNGFRFDTRQYITQDKSNKLGNGKLIIGDIVLTSRGSIGHIAWYNENITKKIPFARINSGMLILRVKNNIDPNVISQYLTSPEGKKKIEAISFGSAQPQLTKASVLKLPVTIPSEKLEQTTIGNYFQKLDSLINQHQQKHDKLSNIKKAMLEKMFPKPDETVPEIRFKGFNEEWEKKLLGDEMTITSVKRILQSDWTTSGVRFLRARDIVSTYKNEKSADYLYIAREKYNEYSQISGKVEAGDLLVTGVGTIGVPMLITNNEPIYFKDGNIIWFKNENKIDGMFLYYSFVGDLIQTYIKYSAGTGTVGTYTISSGKNTPIKLPTKEEQTAIGNYFQKLDTLINQHQQQITKLNNIKQACLNKMFI